jgi:putative ABC transport system permease protein
VIVAQTIYATTVDHIREYGTLKAMGATNRYLYTIIIQQAVISAVIGYVLGMIVSAVVVNGSSRGGANILLPGWMVATMLGITLAMCISAAVVSVRKVTRLDPAIVFKG